LTEQVILGPSRAFELRIGFFGPIPLAVIEEPRDLAKVLRDEQRMILDALNEFFVDASEIRNTPGILLC
jgi:hypothetical protein